jgi:hypothetical protein
MTDGQQAGGDDMTTGDDQTDSDIHDRVDRLESLVEQQQEIVEDKRGREASLEARLDTLKQRVEANGER